MNEWYIVFGILILAAAAVDFVWTTLWVEGGAGPLTRRLSTGLWRAFVHLTTNERLLSLAGPLILLATFTMWIGLFWCGWTLVFSSSSTSLVLSNTATPVSLADRFYFTGYILFTLGNGEIVPNGPIWQWITIFATATGMFSVTLSVTYLLNILTAVNQKRAFANSVTGIGETSIEIVESAWNQKDFHDLDLLLQSFSADLSKLVSQHQAYPILHYYRSESTQKSSVTAVCILDDALTLLGCVPIEQQPNQLLMKETRSSIASYLHTLSTAHINPAKAAPPIPEYKNQLNNLPIKSEEQIQKAFHTIEDRRKQLLGIIQASARQWPG
ncbi:hypothetical protein JOC78_000415 [Bacillus ectoiniformans]|uniref:potassium channel family protein n=1 Tax=Bacillus ectoiniformans TaxID=1494429 RepID=UPI00195C0D4E|nr:potassium channel family protein [Bacillus ectoiniformans]MBM7647494.1 hypothetical protein [Bacillus ectoiniformans]